MQHRYREQTRFSDPGRFGALLDDLPADVPALMSIIRNVLVHYVAAGITFTGSRLAEVDSRFAERLLELDQRRFPMPLAEPRPERDRVVVCCRDFALLTVSALRHRGVPARIRVGFAPYLAEDWNYDHAVAEYWNGSRWVLADAQLDPERYPFDTADVPQFVTAAQAWDAHRRGLLDADTYGVSPFLPFRGHQFLLDSVLLEVAHRQRDELLLWDQWGAITDRVADELAAMLLAADRGDTSAERALAERYGTDPDLRFDGRVHCMSPSGFDGWVSV
ncbi:transglutaminase-like domain-containing protein [Dactylosporangium fulvum]|uniref:Transglutaminase domain-containing protein n=1 Tax=Dactylosporangium fulvum TaxID=53359 RepID=A0ABY5W9R3_9ACTN|nr:transglutaminase domain-containing protein [Dactylosporangium fulvum]UWP86046.1 transglutaminase domain-containing protein [Dactylosporangium fulvum]